MPDTPLTTNMNDLLDATDVGFLTVTRADGTPHSSCVYHLRDGASILISTEAGRLKARSIRRTGRATYSVHGTAKPYPAFSVEGPARILTEDIAGPTSRLFAKILGADPDPVTDDALASLGRVIIELTPDRTYAASHL